MYLTDWKMTYEEYVDLECQAPCSMYSVLLDHKLIDDPFYGDNEKKYTKLSEKGCSFRCEFEVLEDMIKKII